MANIERLRELAQPLVGARGGAHTLAFYFGPSDLIELLDEVEHLQAEVEKWKLRDSARWLNGACDA